MDAGAAGAGWLARVLVQVLRFQGSYDLEVSRAAARSFCWQVRGGGG